MTSAACPKHMTHGPCGGVGDDGACELGDRPCPFVAAPTVRWAGPASARPRPVLGSGARPFVLADLPHVPLDATSVRRSAAALAGEVDAVLFGDAGWARVQLPPSYRAMLVSLEGVRPWAGLNCRDRNRVALEAELAALADVGSGVHCISGDHTALGHRPDAAPVFDLDSTGLAALAAAHGLTVSVAENPVAPPVDRRGERLAEKARAGAQVCIVNHPGSAARVASFIEAATAAGARDVVHLVCVPVVAGAAGLALLRTFTALALPDGYLDAIAGARSTAAARAAAVERAVAFAHEVLAVDGVAGVNLSSAVPVGEEDAALAATLDIARALDHRAPTHAKEPTT